MLDDQRCYFRRVCSRCNRGVTFSQVKESVLSCSCFSFSSLWIIISGWQWQPFFCYLKQIISSDETDIVSFSSFLWTSSSTFLLKLLTTIIASCYFIVESVVLHQQYKHWQFHLQPHLERKRSRVCFFFSFFSRRLAVVEVTPGVLLATFVYWSCSSCRKLRCHLSWCRVHVYGHLNVALVVVFIVVRSLSSSSPSLVTSFVVLSIANLERSLIFFFADRQLLPFEATAPVNIT